MPFDWTINPYRGCEFGCKYCYARYTHEYMEIDGGEFERKIFVKKDASVLLASEIGKKYSYESKASGGTQAEHIAIGTATDPYQPAEREYGVTRACLEELAKREGLSISIVTKSNQIVRDIDLLRAIAGTIGVDGEYDSDDATAQIGATVGTTCAATGFAVGGGERVAGGGTECGSVGFAACCRESRMGSWRRWRVRRRRRGRNGFTQACCS